MKQMTRPRPKAEQQVTPKTAYAQLNEALNAAKELNKLGEQLRSVSSEEYEKQIVEQLETKVKFVREHFALLSGSTQRSGKAMQGIASNLEKQLKELAEQIRDEGKVRGYVQ